MSFSVMATDTYDKQLDSGLSFLYQPSFLTRQCIHIGNMLTNVATWLNEGSTQVQSPVGPWSKTIVIASIMTLLVICLSFCAMFMDFAFNFEPPPLVSFKFHVYTSQMDFFASNHFPNIVHSNGETITLKFFLNDANWHMLLLLRTCPSYLPLSLNMPVSLQMAE